MNLNTAVVYSVKFSVTNRIEAGGYVNVIFPSQFQNVYLAVVESGLDTSSTCTVTDKKAKCTTEVDFAGGVIGLRIGAMNPEEDKRTDQVVIETRTKDNILIDQNTNAYAFTFSDITNTKQVNLEAIHFKDDAVIGEFHPIEVVYMPRH